MARQRLDAPVEHSSSTNAGDPKLLLAQGGLPADFGALFVHRDENSSAAGKSTFPRQPEKQPLPSLNTESEPHCSAGRPPSSRARAAAIM